MLTLWISEYEFECNVLSRFKRSAMSFYRRSATLKRPAIINVYKLKQILYGGQVCMRDGYLKCFKMADICNQSWLYAGVFYAIKMTNCNNVNM